VAAGEIVSDTGSAPPAVGRGYRHWLASYLAMLRFDIASQRTWLPMFVLTQVLFGAGMAVIYGFYLGPMAPQEALFMVSGAWPGPGTSSGPCRCPGRPWWPRRSPCTRP